MADLTRREFLQAGAAVGSVPLLAAGAVDEAFSFVHVTDTHIQTERRAAEGCAACFEQINRLKPSFIVMGGDLVMDAASVGRQRAEELYTLFRKSTRILDAPLHYVIGNHDVFGTDPASGVSSSTPGYGKRMYEELAGKCHYSFQQYGWRFIVLDSIFVTPDGGYVGRIDDEQLTWLASELRSIPTTQPLVVMTHIPLATAFTNFIKAGAAQKQMEVSNGREVLNMLWPYNLKAVLQGHTHIREVVTYRGCQFITSGAVCGNWWKGPRNGDPEGFGLITVRNGELSWEYRTYGFVADPS